MLPGGGSFNPNLSNDYFRSFSAERPWTIRGGYFGTDPGNLVGIFYYNNMSPRATNGTFRLVATIR